MVCIGGTCSASSFSSVCFFHLTAKIKAYNQILLIGPDCGDEPGVSPRALPLRAGNDKESRAAGAPVSHDNRLHLLTHTWLLRLLRVASPIRPYPYLLLPSIDHPEWTAGPSLTPPPALFSGSLLLSLCLCLIAAAPPVSNPHLDLLLLIGFRWHREKRRAVGKISCRRHH